MKRDQKNSILTIKDNMIEGGKKNGPTKSDIITRKKVIL